MIDTEKTRRFASTTAAAPRVWITTLFVHFGLLASAATAQTPATSPTLQGGVQQNGPAGDLFRGSGGGPTSTNQPGVGGSAACKQVDPECGGTNRVCYNEAYHSTGIVMSVPQSQKLYQQTQGQIWIRCGSCRTNVICWPRPGFEDLIAGRARDTPPASAQANGIPKGGSGANAPPLNAQLQAILRAQGCQAEPNGDIYCRQGSMPHPGPPSPTLSSGLVKSVCRVVGSGISCATDGGTQTPGIDTPKSSGGPSQPGVEPWEYVREVAPPPAPTPMYAPLNWNAAPPCPNVGSAAYAGPYVNYFWVGDEHHYNMNWVSDSRYITVGGHGGAGEKGLGRCGLMADVPPRQIASDVHTLLMQPGNQQKRIRIAACQSADANPADPQSVPLAQQVADAYRELYGVPITVEGYKGDITYNQPNALQSYPCRMFTSRSPLRGGLQGSNIQ